MLVKRLLEITVADQAMVGEKAALLGIVATKAVQSELRVSDGFVFSKEAYVAFVEHNHLSKKIKQLLSEMQPHDRRTAERAAEKIRHLFMKGTFPKEITTAIEKTYNNLKKSKTIIVRSSVVADADVSFAGLFTSMGSIASKTALQSAVKTCFASLYSNAAVVFYTAHSIDPRTLAMAVIIEKEKTALVSGTVTTALPNFAGVVSIVSQRHGSLLVNRYNLAKTQASRGVAAVIERTVGDVRAVLSNAELVTLAGIGATLEKIIHSEITISWLKDEQGFTVVQIKRLSALVRPMYESYRLTKIGKVVVEGQKIGQAIVTGTIRFVSSPQDVLQCSVDDVVVLKTSDSTFDSLFTTVRAIILEDARPMSYGAALCRERSVPCVYGVKKTKQLFTAGQSVTVSCAGDGGVVYQGRLPFVVEKEIKYPIKTTTQVMLALQQADAAYDLASIMHNGVGLLSEETLYQKVIGIHPLALVQYKTLKDKKVRQQIDALTVGYTDKSAVVPDRLAEAIAKVAVAAVGKEVVFRLSAADSVEYAALIGGKLFEHKEKNPLLGWRGVSRYVDDRFKPAFALTCAAIKRVREEWGLTNVAIMVPFCRTIEEAKTLFAVMKSFGLERGRAGLKVYVLCEIPANVLLAKELARLFDGFSISLTNLAQLTFGADRTVFSTKRYNEDESALKQLIKDVITVARRQGCSVGVCDSEALSSPSFISFLVQEGVTNISVPPDQYYAAQEKVHTAEQKLGAVPLSLPHTIFSKSFSMAGVVGLSFMLAGFTCQPVNSRDVDQRIQAAVQDQLVTIKNQVREETKQQDAALYATEQANKTLLYVENGFAHFNMLYPATARVVHTVNSVTFSDWGTTSTSPHFSISYLLANDQKNPLSVLSDVTTTLWNGWPAERGHRIESDAGVTTYVRVFRYGKKQSKHALEFKGDTDNFDVLLARVTDFSLPE